MKLSAAQTGLPGSSATPAASAGPTVGRGLLPEQLLDAYRLMVLSRKLDDKEIQLKNQSQIFFQISGAGHEAILVAAGLHAAGPATTGSIPTTATARCASRSASRRSRCCSPAVGAQGRSRRRAAARCRRTGATRALNIVSQSSPTGTQCLQAVGCAEAGAASTSRVDRHPRSRASVSRRRDHLRLARRRHDQRRRVLGSRSTPPASSSCRCCLLVEDNGYAISVPVEVQTPGGDISRLVRSFPGLHVDSGRRHRLPRQPCARCARRSRYVRARKGPALVHAQGHPPVLALAVRRREAVQDAGGARGRSAARSDRCGCGEFLLAERLATDDDLAAIAADVDREIDRAPPDARWQAPKPRARHRRALRLLARRRPDLARRSTRRAAARGQARHDGRGHQPHAERRDGAQPAHRRLRRGRRRLQPRGGAGAGVRARAASSR